MSTSTPPPPPTTNTTTTTTTDVGFVSIISPDNYFLVEMVLRLVFMASFASLGLVTNIFNVIVFYRQGILADSSTVSLVGLSVSDFLGCVFVFWGGFCYGIWELAYVPHIHFDNVCFVTVDGPSLVWTQVTCMITTFIAIERYVSVVFPFKVKQLFTPRRSQWMVLLIFVATIGLFVPSYAHSRLEWTRKTPNGSLYLDIVPNDAIWNNMLLFEYINGTILRFAAVFLVIACNVGITVKVHIMAKKFRKSDKPSSTQDSSAADKTTTTTGTTSDKNTKNAQKEMKLVRMITIICLLFVVCYATDIVVVILLGGDVGTNYDLLSRKFLFMCSTFLTTVNSSVNIFIYYNMSSRFKEEFQLLVGWK